MRGHAKQGGDITSHPHFQPSFHRCSPAFFDGVPGSNLLFRLDSDSRRITFLPDLPGFLDLVIQDIRLLPASGERLDQRADLLQPEVDLRIPVRVFFPGFIPDARRCRDGPVHPEERRSLREGRPPDPLRKDRSGHLQKTAGGECLFQRVSEDRKGGERLRKNPDLDRSGGPRKVNPSRRRRNARDDFTRQGFSRGPRSCVPRFFQPCARGRSIRRRRYGRRDDGRHGKRQRKTWGIKTILQHRRERKGAGQFANPFQIFLLLSNDFDHDLQILGRITVEDFGVPR